MIRRRCRYPYEPLSYEDDEMRMAVLLPGRKRSPLKIRLFHERIDDLSKIKYEALSYVWGSEENPATIYIHDARFIWMLHVTRNCAEALRHLRRRHRQRTVWVDAICINQDDLDERADQVQFMTHVYSAANNVVVWLGAERQDSNIAMNLLLDVSKHVGYSTANDGMFAKGDAESHWALPGGIVPWSDSEMLAFARFLGRPWFSRLWIWQEVHFGHVRSILHCGRQQISWPRFRAAIISLHTKRFPSAPRLLFDNLRAVHPLCKTVQDTQLGQLIAMRGSKCKERNDRIYTAYATARSFDARIDLEPDYRMPYEQVYVDWATEYLQETRDLRLLTQITKRDDFTTLPSWVPDWSRPRLNTTRDIIGNAHGGAQSVICGISETHLTVVGTIISSIMHKFPTLKEHLDLMDHLPKVQLLESLAKLVFDNVARDDICNAFCRVIACGGVSEQSGEMNDIANLEATVMHIVNTTDSFDLTELQELQVGVMTEYLKGRVVIVANDRRLGLAPVYCNVGDVIAIILGCSVPLVLRPLSEGTYQVVGEAYIEGLMTGEAFWGPLPSAYHVDWRNAGRSIWPAFRNTETGKLTLSDPRRGDLPKDWRDATDAARLWCQMVENVATGEKRILRDADPRLDYEVLEDSRLRQIVLV